MDKLILNLAGIDDFSCPAYCDQYGHLWKDLNLGEGNPDLYSVTGDVMDGEPVSPACAEYDFDPEPFRRSEYEFQYMMLDRLRSDCDYFLGWGNRNASRLYDHDPQQHIDHMKDLWNSFPEGAKPQWLSWEQVLEYEKQILHPEDGAALSRPADPASLLA